MYPDKKIFMKYLTQYGRSYLSKEIEGDVETPISLYQKLEEENSFLLESIENGKQWGTYSHIGRRPIKELRMEDGQSKIGVEVVDTLSLLDHKINQERLPKDPAMQGYYGGYVGYIGYEVAMKYYQVPIIGENELGVPEAKLIDPSEIISYHHKSQMIRLTVHVTNKESNPYEKAIEKLMELEKDIRKEKKFQQMEEKKQVSISSTDDLESYSCKVEKVKEHIIKGDIFQAVPSQRICVEGREDSLGIYRTLRRLNPSPYMYFFKFSDFHIIGASPELLVKLEDDLLTTCPIAGTRKRGRNEEEDNRLEENLLSDEKEIAEHMMLVDLARNDLGKVSQIGTVHVPELKTIRKYSHVMHIVSIAESKKRKDVSRFDALLSCLPAGTVSGAPKKRAMEIIRDVEKRRRGIYAGAIGWFGLNGDMDTCIAIRTIVHKGNKAFVQAGGGVVYDSVPKLEYEETLHKAGALMKSLE